MLSVTLGEVMGGAGDMGQYTTLTYVHYPARKYLFYLYFYVAITYQIKPHEADHNIPFMYIYIKFMEKHTFVLFTTSFDVNCLATDYSCQNYS